jgi:heme A synthase
LSRTGKPYSIFLLTVHKLVSLGIIVYLVLQMIRSTKLAPLSPALLIVGIITGLLFVATMATGGLLSVDKVMPKFVHILHQITPFLVLLSTSGVLYLLFFRPV